MKNFTPTPKRHYRKQMARQSDTRVEPSKTEAKRTLVSGFIPYGKHWVIEEDIKAVGEVLRSNFLVQGPCVLKFEKAICKYTGAKYCVAVSSGTAALHLAVLALEIPEKNEGITTPNTFLASSNALIYTGLTPVFADIDSRTFCIDPKEITKKITKKTKVIIPVDFAGQPADMREISKLAKEKNIFVIEDAAHAFGSRYADGSYVGSCKYSDLTTFSFHPVKTVTTGEGGAITTNSKKLYEKLIMLRSHGTTKEPDKLKKNPGPWYYEMQSLGFNYRLSDFGAALGLSQLKRLNFFIKRRRQIVERYNKAFKNLENFTTPFEKKGVKSAFHLYVALIDFKKLSKTRKQVMEQLKGKGVGTQVHYIPVYQQPYYREHFNQKSGELEVCEEYYEKCLSMPLYPKMTDGEVDQVIRAVQAVIGGK